MNKRTLLLAAVALAAALIALLVLVLRGGDGPATPRTTAEADRGAGEAPSDVGGIDRVAPRAGAAVAEPGDVFDTGGAQEDRRDDLDYSPPPDPSPELQKERPEVEELTEEEIRVKRIRAVEVLDMRIADLERDLAEAREAGREADARKLAIRLERAKQHRELRAHEIDNPPPKIGKPPEPPGGPDEAQLPKDDPDQGPSN